MSGGGFDNEAQQAVVIFDVFKNQFIALSYLFADFALANPPCKQGNDDVVKLDVVKKGVGDQLLEESPGMPAGNPIEKAECKAGRQP